MGNDCSPFMLQFMLHITLVLPADSFEIYCNGKFPKIGKSCWSALNGYLDNLKQILNGKMRALF